MRSQRRAAPRSRELQAIEGSGFRCYRNTRYSTARYRAGARLHEGKRRLGCTVPNTRGCNLDAQATLEGPLSKIIPGGGRCLFVRVRILGAMTRVASECS